MVKAHNGIFALILAVLIGFCSPAQATVVDRIVAVVNSDIITLSELNRAAAPFIEKAKESAGSAGQEEAIEAKIKSDLLQQMVDATLTKQEAGKYGIDVTDQDVDVAIENFKKQNNLDDKTLERGLAAEGLTLEEYRERMKDQILQSMLVNRAVRSKIIVTDSDIKAYYDAHLENFLGVSKFHLKNIVVKTKEDARDILQRLEKGAVFEDLAKAKSIGSNAVDGGDLGLFDISSFSAEIKEAVKPLKAGQFTPVIAAGDAYQIIYVSDIVMDGNKTLEEVSDKIHEVLYREEGEKLFKDWVRRLKENAHIQIML